MNTAAVSANIPPGVANSWRQNAPLQSLLSLRLPVKARWLVQADNERQLLRAASWAQQQDMPLLLLGGGTNLVLRRDFPGMVIRVGLRGISLRDSPSADEVLLRVAAGEDWPNLVRHSLQQGWFGLENLSLIPGTVGAAPVRNIGAYGVELAQFLQEVEVLDLTCGEHRIMPAEDCGLGYRSSLFLHQQPLRFVVTAIHLRLHRNGRVQAEHSALRQALAERGLEPRSIQPSELADIVCELRTNRLPDAATCPNVGSFFTNPIVDEHLWRRLLKEVPDLPWRQRASGYQIAAARLIELAGWKGRRVGKVSVSDRHALVLINDGSGNGEDVLSLAESIVKDIRGKYGLQLEPEPCIY